MTFTPYHPLNLPPPPPSGLSFLPPSISPTFFLNDSLSLIGIACMNVGERLFDGP